MEDHRYIIDLINRVDLKDTATLNEIDARFDCFLHGDRTFVSTHVSEPGFDHLCYKCMIDGKEAIRCCLLPTRSHDAMKDIYPERWAWIRSDKNCLGEARCKICIANPQSDFIISSSSYLPSSNLAELYVKIAAFAHVRGLS